MNAVELLAATLFSSLVGSMHCVGMCTPFAILAMGPPDGSQRNRWLRLSSYHLGRLATYWTMGMGVAFLSSSLQYFAGSNRVSQILGWGVGLTMIGIGIVRMFASFSLRVPVTHSHWAKAWTSSIVKLRRSYGKGPIWMSSFLWGLTSTLLPCGWLYLFVLAAAAAPGVFMSIAMMTAFWIGTLPLLSVGGWCWGAIGPRWQIFVQPFAAGCIISFGAFILFDRSRVDLNSMVEHSSVARERDAVLSLERVRRAADAELPCCRGFDASNP